MITRREMLHRLSALAATLGLPASVYAQPRTQPQRDAFGPLLPTRPFGRHNERITMLGLGGSHFGMAHPQRAAEELAEQTIAQGVRFIDTAVIYGNGDSERRIGKLLVPKYRDALFIMSKTKATTADQAKRDLDDTRRRLGVDTLDLYQMHAIESPADVDHRLDRGVLDALLDAKAQGKVRYLGFTGHNTPAAHRHMLDRLSERGVELDAAQMPINIVDPGFLSFIEGVLPELVKRGYAVFAMKTLAFGNLLGHNRAWANRPEHPPAPVVPDRVSLEDALRFVWSLPVSTLISGMQNAAHLTENAGYARRFTPLDDAQRAALHAKVADAANDTYEFYKAPGVG